MKREMFSAPILVLVLSLWAGCAATRHADGGPLAVPAALRPENTARLLMKLHADGVQIYTCRSPAGVERDRYGWVLRAPDARLYDDVGRLRATHFAGPSWRSTLDGSVVVGQKIKDAPAPQPGAIPWVLLKASSTTGEGQFSSVVAIQRVATEGGSAPAEACGAGNLGAERASPYKADYYFFASAQARKEDAPPVGW